MKARFQLTSTYAITFKIVVALINLWKLPRSLFLLHSKVLKFELKFTVINYVTILIDITVKGTNEYLYEEI